MSPLAQSWAATVFDDILVPTDGSDCARAAVGYAEDLAQRDELNVHVLSVVDSRTLENAPQSERIRDERADIATRTRDRLSDSGVSAERDVLTGIPHEAILRYTATEDVDRS